MKIRFFHIQKTAGTSLSRILARQYPGEWFHCSGVTSADVERFRALSTADRSRLVGVNGHASLITGEPAIDELPTLTFLREPIARVKSFCQHVSEGKSAYLLESFPPDTFDLGAFIASGNTELMNLQTRMILGEGATAPVITGNFEAAAERAFERLRRRRVLVGFQEHFDASVVHLAREFRWTRPIPPKRLNQAGATRLLTFPDEVLATFREWNQADTHLYRLALRRLGPPAFGRPLAYWIRRFIGRAAAEATRPPGTEGGKRGAR